MEDREKLDELIHEINAVKIRLTTLEELISDKKPTVERNAEIIQVASQPITPAPPSPKSSFKETFLKDGLETLIGKNLLNRVGIIVLLFAVGYFMKYSFDNNWIGPLGRVVIGFTIGIIFLTAGDIFMKRGYRYFAQGVSGGGIAVIYLSTFAAVNLYHLIPSYTAFGLLVLTAVSGGFLAVRQDAFGLAFIATLGGFMAPFLIGSRSGNMTAMFTYISILDLTVLYLAYHKNWRFLNALALVGTIFVYIAYNALSYQSELKYLLIRETFLLIFFLIFGSLSFIYNVRQKLASRAGETLLTFGNAGFFFIASYINLVDRYEDTIAWLAVGLAVVYLMVSRWLIQKNPNDKLLYLTSLGTGLTFVTVAIPLQFHEHWVETAWLVEAIALVYAGFYTRTRLVQLAGLGMLFVVSLITAESFPWYIYKPLIPLFNVYSLNAALSLGGLILASYFLFTSDFLGKIRSFPGWILSVGSVIFTLYYLGWEVANALKYFHLTFSYNFALSLTWVFLALLLFLVGLLRDTKVLRFLALGLFIITTLKVMLLDLSYMPIVFRIIILTVVGLILMAVSFAYQKAERNEKED